MATAVPSPQRYISQDDIEEIADQIRINFHSATSLSDSVIDIEKIAAELNCSIEIVDFNPGDISARVIRDPSDKSRYRIQISSKEGPLNKRFLIAHEISHIIIHDDGKDQFVELSQPLINYATEDLMYKEVQANILATAILLPKEQVMKAWKACRSIDQVAEIFNVSKAATSLRLDGLGLLEGE